MDEEERALLRGLIDSSERIYRKIYQAPVYNPIMFSYPANGTFATFGEGTTTLNFENGEVKDYAGIFTRMERNLHSSTHDKEDLRSLYIYTEAPLTIRLDVGDKFPIDSSIKLNHLKFKKLTMEATGSTRAMVITSTDPNASFDFKELQQQVYASKIDTDGSGAYFEDADATLGDTPSLYMSVAPPIAQFKVTTLEYDMIPTANETYELYLFEKASASDLSNTFDLIYSSGSKNGNTRYTGGDDLPIEVNLDEIGKLYYLIDWSGDPGNTLGYIKIRGEAMR